ncbi:MAG: hypothetical protein IH945_01930 [Armatimonadetes bacterium]|nr:hypothetical protein [Armatimonadota bacterium]
MAQAVLLKDVGPHDGKAVYGREPMKVREPIDPCLQREALRLAADPRGSQAPPKKTVIKLGDQPGAAPLGQREEDVRGV